MALPVTEDLVEEILLRIPPDEPAHLIRAALVCKVWRGILSDAGFLRRYRRFHRTPPLLGYIHNVQFYGLPELRPTTAFSPPLPQPPPMAFALGTSYRALDCRHGRVLIHKIASPAGLVVWDPITGDRQQVRLPAAYDDRNCSFAAAVLCARHGGCDHLDCHGGPFLVVYVGIMEHVIYTWATVYSSETGAWSAKATASHDDDHYWDFTSLKPGLLIGDAIYFGIACPAIRILKYDLGRHRMSMVDAPKLLGKVAPIDIDGSLGLIESRHDRIYMWSRQAGDPANGVGGWVPHNVAELEMLIPTRRHRLLVVDVIRFAEGTNTILFSLDVDNSIDRGVFTLDLKSRQVRKVAQRWDYDILPYVSFYTPDFAKGKLSMPS